MCMCTMLLQDLRVPQTSTAMVSVSVRRQKPPPARQHLLPIWTSTSPSLERKALPALSRCVISLLLRHLIGTFRSVLQSLKVACCRQVYEDWESLKLNDTLEVYGVLSVSPALSALADEK